MFPLSKSTEIILYYEFYIKFVTHWQVPWTC